MPENTVYVGRGTPWGNPFVVGEDGTRAECVDLYAKLLRGYICLTSKAKWKDQIAVRAYTLAHIDDLRGKNLACWCSTKDGKPCHADVLLELANTPPKE